jgi:hypothetical protein
VISNATLSTTAVDSKQTFHCRIDGSSKQCTNIGNYFNKLITKLVIEHSEISKFVGEVRAEFAKAPEKVGKNSSIAIGIASKNDRGRDLQPLLSDASRKGKYLIANHSGPKIKH